MSFVEWPSAFPGLQVESAQPHSSSFFSMVTVGALSENDSAVERSRHLEQTSMTGRRLWKTLKGQNGEAVWPPNLEAALLDGLKRYHQHTWRPALDRFPMRNRFISDYVYEVTGKRRTAKQVGSRLQQLKDTCRQERILRFLQPPTDYLTDKPLDDKPNKKRDTRRAAPAKSSSSSRRRRSPVAQGSDANQDLQAENTDLSGSQCSPGNQSTLAAAADAHPQQLGSHMQELDDQLLQPTHLNAYVTLEKYAWTTAFTSLTCTASFDPGYVHLSTSNHYLTLRYTSPSNVGPTLTFISPFPLYLETDFLIFCNDSKTTVHHEQAIFTYHPSHSQAGSSGFTYTVTFVPIFWYTLSQSTDPTKFVVQQQVFPCYTPKSPRTDSVSKPEVTTITYYSFADTAWPWGCRPY